MSMIFEFNPLEIRQAGRIGVSAVKDGKRYRLGSLRVVSQPLPEAIPSQNFPDQKEAANRGGLIRPNALSTFAFEHMKEIAGVGVDHRPAELQSIAAETADLVGLILDSRNLLGSKYVHGGPTPKRIFRQGRELLFHVKA
jgi:hypothetical protein